MPAMRLLMLLGLCLLPACGGGGVSASEPLRVQAAASLRDLFEELGDLHEQRTGQPVVLMTGGSNLIAMQVLAGARADVFASASTAETELLVESERMAAADARELFANSLVLVSPLSSHLPEDTPLVDLLGSDPDLRLALAHTEAVPAGRYARAWLESTGLWSRVESRTIAAVDVRAALGAVATGAVDLGLVYRTDALASDSVRVLLEVPGDELSIIYGGGVLARCEQRDAAEAFLELVTGADPAGATVLERHGFLTLAPAAEAP